MSFRTIKVWTYIWYPTAARSFHVYVEWYDHNCMINGAIMAASFGIMYDCCVNHNGRCPWIYILNRNRIWNHCNHRKAFSLFELSKMYRLLNGGQMWSKTSSTRGDSQRPQRLISEAKIWLAQRASRGPQNLFGGEIILVSCVFLRGWIVVNVWQLL